MSDSDIIHDALVFMRTAQASNGSFVGHASTDPANFEMHREHPTPFFTALILNSLADIQGIKTLQRRGVHFLLHQRSPQWSWNYWQRGSVDESQRPYPDDLDDTAVALAALHTYDKTLLTGTVHGHIASNLIACETAPGGPYHTWLVEERASGPWADVDLAVNANIGYLLKRLDVRLPALLHYVDTAIKHDNLLSSYYPGIIPIIYFLARWYDGEGVAKLRWLLLSELEKPVITANPLLLAMGIASACRLEISHTNLILAVQKLISLRTGDHWPARALYYEPPIDDVRYYAGSEALTTAFALEALHLTEHLSTVRDSVRLPQSASPLLRDVERLSQDFAQPDLRDQYRTFAKKLIASDAQGQITAVASLTAHACGRRLSSEITRKLNMASLHGWIAYTIYDDILDNEVRPSELGVANFALRTCRQQFHLALPEKKVFQALVDRALNTVDGANTWEVLHARATLLHQSIRWQALPDYGDFSQLAEKSWGHVLAATGTLVALGYSLESVETDGLRDYFHHFLVARQLNDDAHDWEDDVAEGRLTAVVTMLFNGFLNPGTTHFNLKKLPDLQEHFWRTTIDQVTTLITKHLDLARQALQNCPFKQMEVYESWLDHLEQSCAAALQKRNETQEFITSYTG